MELSRLLRKEIINISDGSRLGYVGESDLVFNGQTGEIISMIVTPKGISSKLRQSRELVIPWTAIKKVGEELLIVDIASEQNMRK